MSRSAHGFAQSCCAFDRASAGTRSMRPAPVETEPPRPQTRFRASPSAPPRALRPERSAPSLPDPLAEDAPPELDDGSPMEFRLGIVVEALWIPALLFDTDVSDDNTFQPTGRVEARARAGLGWGLRAGPSAWRKKGKRWFAALGGMYVTSEHHERKTDGKV